MYKFTLTDKFRQRGVSPDAISPEMRNQFDAIFSESGSTLDRKIQVRLDEKVIRFFYYLEDVNEDVLIEKNYKEIASISLTNVKETGYDILHFRKQVIGKCPEKKLPDIDSSILNNLVGHPKSNEENLLIYNFPFVDGWNFDDQTNEPISKEQFAFLMQCCFLYFILDMENRESDLAQSPLYEDVRGKLRQSDVYQLLCAKLKYTIRLYKDVSPLSQDDYSFVTQKFADRLMDSRINKVIAPYDYPDKESYCVRKLKESCFVRKTKTWGIRLFTKKAKTSTQLWFYDPEVELEAILEKNRKQEHLQKHYKNNHKSDQKGQPICLEDSLLLKIRDFLYSKHALGHAMVERIGKHLFACGQWIMAISSLSLLLAIILSINEPNLFDCIVSKVFPICIAVFSFAFIIYIAILDCVNRKKETNNSVKYKWRCHQLLVLVPLLILITTALLSVCTPILRVIVFCIIVALAVLYFILFSGLVNKNGWVKVFLPRILVAELAAWLTIGIAEDLVKSMLWIDEWWILVAAIVAVVILISIILFGEIKQHSPYINGYKIIQRDLYIFNHALFFAMGFGIIMQVIFYDNLIKNSDVIASVVFNDYFDDANYYCQNLIDLDNAKKQYHDYCSSNSSLKNIEMYGSAISNQKYLLNDSTLVQTTTIVKQKTSRTSKEGPDNHNNIVEHYNEIVNNLNDFYKNHVDTNEKTWINHTLRALNDTVDSINDRIKIENQEKLRRQLPVDLGKEISRVRRNMLKSNNYDTLMSWATITHSVKSNTGSACLDTLTVEAIREHNCCYDVNLKIGKEPKRIFPTLLIFHTLIVLVLAFVTQLLISDKSVTEPL